MQTQEQEPLIDALLLEICGEPRFNKDRIRNLARQLRALRIGTADGQEAAAEEPESLSIEARLQQANERADAYSRLWAAERLKVDAELERRVAAALCAANFDDGAEDSPRLEQYNLETAFALAQEYAADPQHWRDPAKATAVILLRRALRK